MKPDDFVALVEQLRAAQRRYFITRHGDDLSTAKELERRVDREIKEMRDKQGKLF